MFKLIVIVVAVLLLAIFIYAWSKPDAFHVERSVSIKAPPEKIFTLINDFHQWEAWTPYAKDPAMKKIFSGNDGGKGAVYAWQGNSAVGEGKIAITDSTPPVKIWMDLHMIKPFEGHNKVIFTLNATGEITRVTWGMDGTQNFIVKVMGLFLSMDQMVGKDFEVGLEKMKAVAEK